MTKKLIILNVFLVTLSCIVGWTLSKAAIVGKAGIHFVYQEYRFLNTWWKGALVVWAIWVMFEIIQYLVWKKYNRKTNLLVHTCSILIAVIGLYFTYLDFRTLSHRMLGERFHIGGYLFWVGWCLISIFFLSLTDQNSKTIEVGLKE